MILSYDMILENLPRTDRQIKKKIITPSLLPYIIEITARTAAALYCRKKLENLLRTNRQTDRQTHRQRIQLQRPLLSPVDCRGEWANKLFTKRTNNKLKKITF